MPHESTGAMSRSDMLEAALRYADLGYPVFPCKPGEKTPLTEHGFKDATTDETKICDWWTKWPDANIAISTSGLLVVDIDGKENPWLSRDPDLAQDLTRGSLSLTPRGGRHHIFRDPKRQWKNTAGKIAPNVDTRADGGYILVAPSMFDGKTYRWVESMELDRPEALPEPPAWLTMMLEDRASRSILEGTASANPIPPGHRNDTLMRLAGSMRRVGMSIDEILAAITTTNRTRCNPPLPDKEVARIATSICRYEPDQVSVAMIENHWGQDIANQLPPSFGEIESRKLELRPAIVHGLLREGETMNVIAPPKSHKSWLVNDLALAIATGRRWIDTYPCEQGNVLIIDNELHVETSADRIPRVMRVRGIRPEEVRDRLYIDNLRGRLTDLLSMGPYFERFEPGQFKIIILDAFYRFMPMQMDENDNGTMATLYNQIDRFADKLKCAFVLIHHTTKGNQSAKGITDVGAGAGAQSRATDTHLVLRSHREDDVAVLHAAVRSWPPPPPRCFRWVFPTWEVADELDPADLDGARRPKEESASESNEYDMRSFVESFISEDPRSQARILEEAEASGLSSRRIKRFLVLAQEEGLVHPWSIEPRNTKAYATTKPPEQEERRRNRDVVLDAIRNEPKMSPREIAEQCGVSLRYVQMIRKEIE